MYETISNHFVQKTFAPIFLEAEFKNRDLNYICSQNKWLFKLKYLFIIEMFSFKTSSRTTL